MTEKQEHVIRFSEAVRFRVVLSNDGAILIQEHIVGREEVDGEIKPARWVPTKNFIIPYEAAGDICAALALAYDRHLDMKMGRRR